MPIRMLKEHVDSDSIRATPISNGSTTEGRSKPSTEDTTLEKRAKKRPRISSDEGYDYNDISGYDDDDDDKESEGEFVSYTEHADEEELESQSKELSSEDISYLVSALSNAESPTRRDVLLSEHLHSPPDPKLMKNKYRSVNGDAFHAMDRTKVGIKHEAKKGFFVALRDAFFVWNPRTIKELEERMRASGMTDDEIRRQKYFNTQLFRGCIDRKIPPSSILYWRVRAVYVAYGSIIDSKTKKPLFNERAWKKANNVLKEIEQGFYSDLPGIELYNKRLRANGTVMTNKYGMELIECFRGTNRTEAYHKNIHQTFGTWPLGIRISDCLLRERRHRHNHRMSEKRRHGFHKFGHYDTWKIDLHQRLALRNHGVLIYPNWTNTSDYQFTDESFDTIPLQTQELHEAVVTRHNDLDKKAIKLTDDQKYPSKVMGTPLPFLPFSGENEYKAYAKFVNETEPGILNDDEAAASCLGSRLCRRRYDTTQITYSSSYT